MQCGLGSPSYPVAEPVQQLLLASPDSKLLTLAGWLETGKNSGNSASVAEALAALPHDLQCGLCGLAPPALHFPSALLCSLPTRSCLACRTDVLGPTPPPFLVITDPSKQSAQDNPPIQSSLRLRALSTRYPFLSPGNGLGLHSWAKDFNQGYVDGLHGIMNYQNFRKKTLLDNREQTDGCQMRWR